MELALLQFLVINMYTLYTNTIHGLGIDHFNTNDECLKFIEKIKPKAYKIVPVENQLPMQFYPAFYWNEEKNSPDINLYVAIELKKEELRILREPLLQKLDILFIKALEQDNQDYKNKIVNYKNALRNITNGFFPSDVGILLYFYPTILNEINLFVQN
jgi:hypothetical protein